MTRITTDGLAAAEPAGAVGSESAVVIEIHPASRWCTVVSAVDVSLQQRAALQDAVREGGGDHRPTVPGLVSATVLERHEPGSGGAGEPAQVRLVEYVQWESGAAHRRFLDSHEGREYSVLPVGVTPGRSDRYLLDAVITTGGGEGGLSLFVADPRLTLVVVMEPHAGRQSVVNEFNQVETRDFFAGFDGFIGAAFHLADHGGVLEYLQWESREALEVVTATERFSQHLAEIGRHCHSTEFGTYDVVHAVARDGAPGVRQPVGPEVP